MQTRTITGISVVIMALVAPTAVAGPVYAWQSTATAEGVLVGSIRFYLNGVQLGTDIPVAGGHEAGSTYTMSCTPPYGAFARYSNLESEIVTGHAAGGGGRMAGAWSVFGTVWVGNLDMSGFQEYETGVSTATLSYGAEATFIGTTVLSAVKTLIANGVIPEDVLPSVLSLINSQGDTALTMHIDAEGPHAIKEVRADGPQCPI